MFAFVLKKLAFVGPAKRRFMTVQIKYKSNDKVFAAK